MILALAAIAYATELTRFDFEDGTLQGWTVVSGEAGKLPTGPGVFRANVQFNQQGNYFIGLYENPNYDLAQIELKSPTFQVKSSTIGLLVGGGSHRDSCYVALCKASDNSEIARATGSNNEMMRPFYWDVSSLKGQNVYVKIVDANKDGWGHINVDDIHELSPAEEKILAAQRAAKEHQYERWLESVKAPAKRTVYSGKSAGNVAFPLGGIGGGHVSICGDGAVRQWNIFNRVNEGCVVPNSFFAIWSKQQYKEPVVKTLQQTPIDGLPPVDRVEFIGEYPIAYLTYKDKELPVEVSMRAFSPHIPMEARDSAIPAAVFEFTIQNRGTQAVDVSLLSTLQNAAGYDGISQISGTWNPAYGGNVNELLNANNLRGVLMSNPSLKPDNRQYGTMALATMNSDAYITPQWNDILALLRDFSNNGQLEAAGKAGPSERGRTWNTALTVPAHLKPGQKITVPIIWSWHFPNHYVWWDGRDGQPKIGRMYSNWYKDAGEAAGYLATNYNRLSQDTDKFRRTFYKTTLPYWMLDRISAQNSTLVSTVCMWLEDNTFAAFEGTGCCPMNCAHVWNYEQQLAHLFPELERNMRRVDFEVQQEEGGGIRHRTRLPITMKRETGPFSDGHLGTILKSYREFRLSADRSWLDSMWPRIKLAMEYVLKAYDPNNDGVMVHEQWNTYDAAMYGPNTFIGSLYLAALRATEEMAKIEDDRDYAFKMRTIFESGSKRYDTVCWNGEYYQQIEKKPTEAEAGENKWLLEDWPPIRDEWNVNRPYGKGCHSDQLLGQWWANILDLGYLFPKERVNKSLDSIMKYNWVKDFGEAVQTPRPFAGEGDPGLYNCTWPYGGQPRFETLYSFETWTGIEYEVAGLLMNEGRIDEAYKIVKACSDRYNGMPRFPIERNPWAEVECANHYARAMSSWGILLAAQGFHYCGPDKWIEFNPTVKPENHSSFFSTAQGWGLFTQKRSNKRQENTLELEHGTLELQAITLHLGAGIKEALDSERLSFGIPEQFGSINADLGSESDAVTIRFDTPILLNAGDKLPIILDWR